MADTRPEAIRKPAERILAEVFGAVDLDGGTILESSDRSSVTRFAVTDGPSSAPASIIVKRAIAVGSESDTADRPDSPTVRFLNEWASLQYLGEIAPESPLAPRLYGGDRDAGILVMEDLGSITGMTDSLLGDDPVAAEADLISYARTVGRLHGQTAGRTDRYRHIRDSLGSPDPRFSLDWLVPTFHTVLDVVGITPGPSVDNDLAAVEATFELPGDFSAFIHTDPCPDNWARSAAGHRLIDFEFSGIGHALLDGVYGRVPFPTCWCIGQLPEEIVWKMERVYRIELAKGCPPARDDDRYARAVAEACVHWLILLCHWHPLADLLREDREWGTATIRQRLLVRLDVAAQATSDARHLEAIGEVSEALSKELHARWDGEVAPLPLYPAFRTQ